MRNVPHHLTLVVAVSSYLSLTDGQHLFVCLSTCTYTSVSPCPVEDVVALTASMFSSQSLYDSSSSNADDIFNTTASMFMTQDDQSLQVSIISTHFSIFYMMLIFRHYFIDH